MEQKLAGQGGYNLAKMVTEEEYFRDKTGEALEQFSVAMISDCGAMINLAQHVNSNSRMTVVLVKLQEQITVLAQ